jgi:hypothetical protein
MSLCDGETKTKNKAKQNNKLNLKKTNKIINQQRMTRNCIMTHNS